MVVTADLPIHRTERNTHTCTHQISLTIAKCADVTSPTLILLHWGSTWRCMASPLRNWRLRNWRKKRPMPLPQHRLWFPFDPSSLPSSICIILFISYMRSSSSKKCLKNYSHLFYHVNPFIRPSIIQMMTFNHAAVEKYLLIKRVFSRELFETLFMNKEARRIEYFGCKMGERSQVPTNGENYIFEYMEKNLTYE